jgi:hypothetical protein
MSLTIEELKEYLRNNVDEVTLIEDLGIEADRLVEILHDVIDENYEKLIDLYDLEQDSDE